VSAELDLRRGWVAEALREEFPELDIFHATVSARSGRSPKTVKVRLKQMSDRFTGPKAVQTRQQPVPWAYRVFFRQIGIDPDDRRPPAEAVALERMRAGAFHSRNLLDDALLIATVETGVPVLAFDADRVEDSIGLRLADEGERLGGDGRSVRAGQILVADELRPLAVLFGDIARGYGVGPDTSRMLLATVRVKGVPDVSVEEALWTVADILVSAE
jgi:DNA/RNA-binding domain of Phe-tRNA-synthetase-like protein